MLLRVKDDGSINLSPPRYSNLSIEKTMAEIIIEDILNYFHKNWTNKLNEKHNLCFQESLDGVLHEIPQILVNKFFDP
uniref:Uncharacterized protein n=1 Tax=Megaselia scalaris TaxID=36166 RepID=T1GAV6_MEGSC